MGKKYIVDLSENEVLQLQTLIKKGKQKATVDWGFQSKDARVKLQ
jgi:hypothetical protein